MYFAAQTLVYLVTSLTQSGHLAEVFLPEYHKLEAIKKGLGFKGLNIVINRMFLFGTLILLFFFPPLLRYFADIRRARWWLWRGGPSAPSRIEVEPVTKHVKRVAEMGNLDYSNDQLKKEDI